MQTSPVQVLQQCSSPRADTQSFFFFFQLCLILFDSFVGKDVAAVIRITLFSVLFFDHLIAPFERGVTKSTTLSAMENRLYASQW